MPVIMGRNTFESVGSKPLPGRLNIILTKNQDKIRESELLKSAAGEKEALELARQFGTKEVFIAGGAQVYRQFLDKANRIYMTRVHAAFEADTFFPEIDASVWKLISSKDFTPDDKHAYSFSIQLWEREKHPYNPN